MSNQTMQSLVYNIPENLRKVLYPFQKAGILEALRRRGRILIADEMGLGKTIQAICVAMAFQQFPILIVSPAVVKYNWIDELEKWTRLEPENFAIVEGRDDIESWKKCKFVVCTYGLFTKSSAVAGHIADHGFQTVICDESHYLKNLQAVRTTMVCPLIEKARHAILLSGTPCLNRPVELYAQVSALSDSFGTYSHYTRKFCNARRGRFGWDVSGQSNLKELNILLQGVMIRRLKKDVLTQLPSKLRSRVFIEIVDKRCKRKIRKLMENLKNAKQVLQETLEAALIGNEIAMQKGKSAHYEQRRVLMQAFHDTGVGKISGVQNYLNNFLDSCETSKCLVFAHHIDVLDGIEKGISEYSYRGGKKKKRKMLKYVRIDGSTPHHERQLNTQKFQKDPSCRVAIIGMLAGGVGITLTEASHVFFAELHWTPGIILQAEDRAHRIGQKNNVIINYLVAKNSIDEPMWSIICNKVNVTSTALEGCRSSLKAKRINAQRKTDDNDPNLANSSEIINVDAEISQKSHDQIPKQFGKGDVRTFISNLGRLDNENNCDSDIEKDAATLVKESTWSCEVCTLMNPNKSIRCLACLTPRTAREPKLEADSSENPEENRSLMKQESLPEVGYPEKDNQKRSFLHYKVSKYTGRIFLYSEKKNYLKECFCAEDVDNFVPGNGHLPVAISKSTKNIEGVKSFVAKWRSLRSYDQQQLCLKIIKPPLLAILKREQLRKKHHLASKGIKGSMLSFTRFSQKPISPPQETGGKLMGQSVTKFCGHCGNCITAKESEKDPQSATWSGSYCSFACKKQMMIKTSGSCIRREIFKLEKGVCQICHRNMHELYCRIRRLDKPDRLQELLRNGFAISTKAKKLSILNDPKEGDFWQPDHIVPVAEGGGECDMSNIRTLCTPCHINETKALHKRLKDKRLRQCAKGTKDIRVFFGNKGASTPSTQKVKTNPKDSIRKDIDHAAPDKKASKQKRVRFQLENCPPSATKVDRKRQRVGLINEAVEKKVSLPSYAKDVDDKYEEEDEMTILQIFKRRNMIDADNAK